jgi:hypothetical protein
MFVYGVTRGYRRTVLECIKATAWNYVRIYIVIYYKFVFY